MSKLDLYPHYKAPPETALMATGTSVPDGANTKHALDTYIRGGSAGVRGLNVGGKVTKVTVSDAAWVPLPAAALAQRNAINIQVRAPQATGAILINYVDDAVPLNTDVGVKVGLGTERFYDVTENVILYARAEAGGGSFDIFVEEIA